MQLAPNGRLYGSTWNGGYSFLHVVKNPDLKGDSCNFVWGGQPTLSDNSANLPNMPNYRLGALIGSGCDTITSISNEAVILENGIRVMPNPADKYVYVEMGNQSMYDMQLLTVNGQMIVGKLTRQIDIFDTENLLNGIYILKVTDKRNSEQVISKEVVVQH